MRRGKNVRERREKWLENLVFWTQHTRLKEGLNSREPHKRIYVPARNWEAT